MVIRNLPKVGLLCAFLSACQTPTQPSLYQRLGGESGVAGIVDSFIYEINFSSSIFHYFEQTDFDRFRTIMIEHLCSVSDGPCEYSGDSMLESHQGLNISEADFNVTVDLLINAMNYQKVPLTIQNQLLNRLIPLRPQIIYQ